MFQGSKSKTFTLNPKIDTYHFILHSTQIIKHDGTQIRGSAVKNHQESFEKPTTHVHQNGLKYFLQILFLYISTSYFSNLTIML